MNDDPRPDHSIWRYAPARDLGLRGLDRLSSTRRETGLLGSLAGEACARSLAAYMRLAHRLRVEGAEHIGNDAPGVIVANHSSHMDAPAIIAALSCRQRRSTYVVAAADRFFSSTSRAGPTAGLLNALALRRGRGGRHALDDLRERLAGEPCRLIVFPEGTRSRTGEIGPFREGVGMLVAGTTIPVVPCRITGAHDALPPAARVPRPRRIACRFGTPRTFEETPHTRTGWAEVAHALRGAVLEILPEGRGRAGPPQTDGTTDRPGSFG